MNEMDIAALATCVIIVAVVPIPWSIAICGAIFVGLAFAHKEG